MCMRNIKLIISYDGTNYSGWQSQSNGVTIQDKIERAIYKVLREKIRVTGASRTDAGVHARMQVANFKTESTLPLANIINGINRNLPRDIAIRKGKETSIGFHSQYHAKSKLYRYTVTNQSPVSPFEKDYVLSVRKPLNVDDMKREARHLKGLQDFSSFQGARSKRDNTIREIYSIEINKRGKTIYIDVEANGFLYNMMRIIAGTLIGIGRGHLKKDSIKRILAKKRREYAGMTVPAKGLCLMKVRY